MGMFVVWDIFEVFGGVELFVEMIVWFGVIVEKVLLVSIEDCDSVFVEDICLCMFMFVDIVKFDDCDIQCVLCGMDI